MEVSILYFKLVVMGIFYKLFIGDYPNSPINGPITFFEQKLTNHLQ
jgi:hypothetical protein